MSQRFKRLLCTSVFDSRRERLRCNEAVNDCDLGPDEFQLEMQSIVRRVLTAYVNGVVVCEGPVFRNLICDLREVSNIITASLFFASSTRTTALKEALQSKPLLAGLDRAS